MNVFQLRFVGAGLFFLWIVPSGLWLKHAGKPYSVILFNLHKLIGLGVFVFLAINVYRMNRSASLSPFEWTSCVVNGLLFIATIISGGLTSINKPVVPIVHKVLPYLTVVSTGLSLYLLVR